MKNIAYQNEQEGIEMKRIWAILLTMALCFSLLSLETAVQGASVEDLSYQISGGKVTITECKKTASGALTIPETIKGYPVTAIGCYAFYYCKSLTDITIPSGVTEIGDVAFSGCDSLQGIWVHANNPSFSSDDQGVLYNKDKTVLLRVPTTFSGAYQVRSSVTCIGGGAFDCCIDLTRVTLPENLTKVVSGAFYGCRGLSYNIYDTGRYLGSVSNPYLVLMSAVDQNITSITISEQTKFIYQRAFECHNNLTGVVLPESVIQIGMGAFESCKGLTTINIPKNITEIEAYALAWCNNLKTVYFAGDVPHIGAYALEGVTATGYYHSGNSSWNGTRLFALALHKADHIWPAYVYDNNHTCTTDGTERAVCRTCGVVDVRKVEGSAAHRITYTSNQDATCDQDGTRTGSCRVCGLTETVTDQGTAKGHAFSAYVSDGNATCITDGTKTAVCGTCGLVSAVADKGSALGHAYSKYISNGDATCTTDGTKSAICANCGNVNTVTDQGSALGHSFTCYISDCNATCIQDGTETAQCDRCGVTDIRIQTGSADHWYIGGTCLWCDQPDPDPRQAVLTGNLTISAGEALLTLQAVGRNLPHQTLTVTGDTYTLTVDKGQYDLTVTKEGYGTRTYRLTLTGGENVLDITLCPMGDVNGDGDLTIGDVAMLYAHIRAEKITGLYALQCADVMEDDSLNVLDVARLYAHIMGTLPLNI